MQLRRFPKRIPVGTEVPAWAYLDITQTNDWDPTGAEAYEQHNATEISASLSPTLSSAGSPSMSSAPSDVSVKTNVGAIAGAVVGGASGLALLVVGGILLWRRHSIRSRASQREDYATQSRVTSPTIAPESAPLSPTYEKTFAQPSTPTTITGKYDVSSTSASLTQMGQTLITCRRVRMAPTIF